MPRYISCHTIACMTMQQVRHLKECFTEQSETRLRRLVGSQIAGKLLLEVEAPARESLEQLFGSNRIHYDWLLRVEFDEQPSL